MDKWDVRFMEMARLVSTWTSCVAPGRAIGAVIVKDKRIMTTGYNGAPQGLRTCKERGYCMRRRLGIASVRSTLALDGHSVFGDGRLLSINIGSNSRDDLSASGGRRVVELVGCLRQCCKVHTVFVDLHVGNATACRGGLNSNLCAVVNNNRLLLSRNSDLHGIVNLQGSEGDLVDTHLTFVNM